MQRAPTYFAQLLPDSSSELCGRSNAPGTPELCARGRPSPSRLHPVLFPSSRPSSVTSRPSGNTASRVGAALPFLHFFFLEICTSLRISIPRTPGSRSPWSGEGVNRGAGALQPGPARPYLRLRRGTGRLRAMAAPRRPSGGGPRRAPQDGRLEEINKVRAGGCGRVGRRQVEPLPAAPDLRQVSPRRKWTERGGSAACDGSPSPLSMGLPSEPAALHSSHGCSVL